MSSTTKQEIALATKKLVTTGAFNSVTVASITKAAGLARRQTFYDYYRDKYEVLADIYQVEVKHAAYYCGEFAHWPDTVVRIMTYFDENRPFYQAVFKLDTQNAPVSVVQAHIASMIGDVLLDLMRRQHLQQSPDYFAFQKDLLAAGLTHEVQAWVQSPTPRPLKTEIAFLQQYLQDGLSGFLQRLEA